MLTAVFQALLPSEDDQMILRSNYSGYDSASSKMFSLVIFAMANNFAGLNSVPIEQIMDFLNRHASTRLLQHLLRTSGPESEALAEKLFPAAILMEDARIVKALLQKGLVPNDLICVHDGARYTPLEYSSMVRNVEITRLLLDAKIDVNRSIAGARGSGSAIACAIEGQWRREYPHEDVRFELVNMLLEAGCTFSWQQFSFTTLQGNQKVLDLLLDNSFKTKTYNQAWNSFAKYLGHCDNATAAKTYKRFLETGVHIPKSGFEPYFCEPQAPIHGIDDDLPPDFWGGRPIDIAAERGNLELVQLLLRFLVPSTRETLTCAVRSKNKELIGVLLDYGVDIFDFKERTTEYWYSGDNVRDSHLTPSPLSEAIRSGDAEILEVLEENGAWSRIVNRVTFDGEFEDVLLAATVRGQLNTVRKLLNYRPPNTHGLDLKDALVAAIYLNEDAIVLTLLDAGANVNGGFYKDPDVHAAVGENSDSASSIDAGIYENSRERSHRGPALVEALLQKNEQLVQLILDADVYFSNDLHVPTREPAIMTPLVAALEWGNLSIIEEVISIGVGYELDALGVSVRTRGIECTQLLVNAGVPISPDALSIAVTNNDVEMVEYLFSRRCGPGQRRRTLPS